MTGSNVIALVGGLLVFLLVLLAILIAQYIVTALGMYRLASRYQVANPWLAWIPVASNFLLGKIAEVHDARRGIRRKWGMVLLVLSLIQMGGQFIFNMVYSVVMMPIISYSQGAYHTMPAALIGSFVVFIIATIVMAIAGTGYASCSYVCMYKNLEAIAPEKTVKYFLLSLLVPFAYGIILMKCCKKGYVEPMAESQERPVVPQEYISGSMREMAAGPDAAESVQELTDGADAAESAQELTDGADAAESAQELTDGADAAESAQELAAGSDAVREAVQMEETFAGYTYNVAPEDAMEEE